MEVLSGLDSSTIAEIAYEGPSQILQITFQNSSIYQYFDVPNHVWEAFKMAGSKGVYLNSAIKGQFRYSKV
jgi:hypothetical protein